ncbi:hypothetical protein R4Y45_06580 [Holzapfeliella sp. He02]|uniref:Uncharacterized protein n=1 Tax=Holzapfeliella saturejae TaxID=3082953 RepID=A0ABU8SHM4_9LACO
MKETHRRISDLSLPSVQEMTYLRLKYEQQLTKGHKSDYSLGYDQAKQNLNCHFTWHHYPEKLPSLSSLSHFLTDGAFQNYLRGYEDAMIS